MQFERSDLKELRRVEVAFSGEGDSDFRAVREDFEIGDLEDFLIGGLASSLARSSSSPRSWLWSRLRRAERVAEEEVFYDVRNGGRVGI